MERGTGGTGIDRKDKLGGWECIGISLDGSWGPVRRMGEGHERDGKK